MRIVKFIMVVTLVGIFLPLQGETSSMLRRVTNKTDKDFEIKWRYFLLEGPKAYRLSKFGCKPKSKRVVVKSGEIKTVDIKIPASDGEKNHPDILGVSRCRTSEEAGINKIVNGKIDYDSGTRVSDDGKGKIVWRNGSFQKKKKHKGFKSYYSKGVNLTIEKDGTLKFSDA